MFQLILQAIVSNFKYINTATFNTFLKSSVVDGIKNDVLLQIERLANPPWIKQAKQALLHHKQKNPEIFQDLCLYSDACKMFSEYTYRLGPRRMIHELFFDLNFTCLYTEAKGILKQERHNCITKSPIYSQCESKCNYMHVVNEQRRAELSKIGGDIENCLERFSPRSPPLSSVKEELASSENLNMETQMKSEVVSAIKTLDSLKLSYKENKFPIRERNSTK